MQPQQGIWKRFIRSLLVVDRFSHVRYVCISSNMSGYGCVFDVNGTSLMTEETASTSKTARVSRKVITTSPGDHGELCLCVCVHVCSI